MDYGLDIFIILVRQQWGTDGQFLFFYQSPIIISHLQSGILLFWGRPNYD